MIKTPFTPNFTDYLLVCALQLSKPSQLVGQRTSPKNTKENSHPFSEARCACWSAPCRPPPCPPGAAHAGFCSSPSCCSASTSASRSSLTNLLTTMRSRLFRSIIVCLRHARCSQLQSFFAVRRASSNFLCKSSSVSDSCKSDCSSTRIFPFTLGCCSALALSPVQRAGRNHLSAFSTHHLPSRHKHYSSSKSLFFFSNL